jgi:hypothetical protein
MNIERHPILKQCYDLCIAIESLGASPGLTEASLQASNLLRLLDLEIVADSREEKVA